MTTTNGNTVLIDEWWRDRLVREVGRLRELQRDLESTADGLDVTHGARVHARAARAAAEAVGNAAYSIEVDMPRVRGILAQAHPCPECKAPVDSPCREDGLGTRKDSLPHTSRFAR